MSQDAKPLPPLSLPRAPVVGEHPFEGDVLQRKELASRMTGYIDRLRAGAVLAIDAPWGEGKTWFGRNWAKALANDGHRVAFIDAFEQDYIDDPFLLIAAEMSVIFEKKGDEKSADFRKTASKVLKAILPFGTKVLVTAAGRAFLGATDLSESIQDAAEKLSDDLADETNKWVEHKFEEYSTEKTSLQHFKTTLQTCATSQEKPIIIFVDELDRCRPTFAVRLVERLKHFFDVPNLIFILLLNRDQLERAVTGTYGAGVDSSAYLNKFVNFFFSLPKRSSSRSAINDHARSYIAHELGKYKFDQNDELRNFTDTLGIFAVSMDFSLRDIERAVALYAFAQPVRLMSFIMAYAITLKLAKPDLFKRLLGGTADAHKEARNFVEALQAKIKSNDSGAKRLLDMLYDLHTGHMAGFKNKIDSLAHIERALFSSGLDLDRLFPFLAERLELPLQR